MNKPEMIIFDYGQTLVDESKKPFDGLKGTEAVLREAANNPNNASAEDIKALSDELKKEIGIYGTDSENHSILEVHNFTFQNYIYEYFGIEITKSSAEVERIFERAACHAEPTKNIIALLQFLDTNKIRTGVISNMSFSGRMLKERINRYIPNHNFEFIIASSDYVFKKPYRRIFELALRKAKLDPHEAWYCGDNAVFDVDGSSGCGINPVWYKGAIDKSNKSVPSCGHIEINDWNALVEILNKTKEI